MLFKNKRKVKKVLFASALLCFGLFFLFMNKQQTLATYAVIDKSSHLELELDTNSIIKNSVPDSAVFNKIYKKHLWGIGSGVGSQESNTVQYRELLQKMFNDERFNSFVDFGCGDFQIMELVKVPSYKSYVGIDAVADIIKENKEFYGSQHPNYQFHHIEDMSALKRGSEMLKGDLIIVKDVLQHLPNQSIKYFIDNILPNFKYALITNDYSDDVTHRNSDIAKGLARPVDLTYPPFNLKNMELVLQYKTPSFIFLKRSYLYTNPNL